MGKGYYFLGALALSIMGTGISSIILNDPSTQDHKNISYAILFFSIITSMFYIIHKTKYNCDDDFGKDTTHTSMSLIIPTLLMMSAIGIFESTNGNNIRIYSSLYLLTSLLIGLDLFKQYKLNNK
jgi:hypothetical protein